MKADSSIIENNDTTNEPTKNNNTKNDNIKSLQEQIETFKQKNKKSNITKTTIEKKNLMIVYNVVADLAGGIITAFILNKIYSYFFVKNVAIFALLLIFCSIAGLYNAMRLYIRK